MAEWRLSGEPIGSVPIVGQRYKVIHVRKGTFFGTVQRVDGIWAEVLIDQGKANAILPENVVTAGDFVTVRDTLATFIACH